MDSKRIPDFVALVNFHILANHTEHLSLLCTIFNYGMAAGFILIQLAFLLKNIQ